MRKLSVMTRVSSLAIAAALTASASAQSFNGTPTVAFGSVNITEGATTTDLDVSSTTAVIDWTPDDNLVGNFGAIAFQNNGTTATFSSAVDFAVLNRINVADPSRLIAMDGTINSLVNGQTGGSIFFYSPSGFVIGPHAAINVGSLVLTARPVTVDGNGNFITNGVVEFGIAADPFGNTVNPNAPINTVSDVNGTAQINASGAGSYVALVAPTIRHQGVIRTDGAAALVAAEAATITFSPDGLFNIQVTTGTDAATGIQVDGGTIDRNSATEGVFDHRAYLVAVAKNDAVTMLINNGGSVGFDTATSAAVENNVVVLSGGYDISGGTPYIPSGTSTVALNIPNANFSSDVFAQVSGVTDISTSTGNISFGRDLTVIGGDDTYIYATNGNTLSIGGNLTADASIGGAGITGNYMQVGAYSGSALTIGGDVSLTANALGTDAQDDGQNGANATGGSIVVEAKSNSTVDIGGNLDMNADGYGGSNFFSNGAGGNGTGGQISLLADNGAATLTVSGSVNGSAQGYGGSSGECSVCNITGGTGMGGSIFAFANIGATNTLALSSDVTLTAAGNGGAGDAGGGNGIGGQASLGAADGSTTTVGADTFVDASGFGGYGFSSNGGNGFGGAAAVGTNGSGSQLDLTGPAFVTANGQGGDGGQGGNGTGGQADIHANQGTVHAHGNATIAALSIGGSGFISSSGNGVADIETAATPDITEALIFSAAGTVIVDGLTTVSANATGGDGSNFAGADGGNAVAGSAHIDAVNRDVGTSTIQLGNTIVMADAFGGAGGSGTSGTDGGDGGNGGNATAGRALMSASAGSGDLSAGATILSASAEGGAGGSGGNGDGGNGGSGGDGGQATGGFINVGTVSGNTNFAQGANNGVATYTTIVALTTATGGAGGDGSVGTVSGIGGRGGNAFGGNSALLVRGSLLTVGNVNLDASAQGGDGGLSPDDPNGDGGDATAGHVRVIVTNRFNLPLQRGTLVAGNITGTATATGGIGGLNNGQSLSIGGNQFVVLNSDATINSVSLVNTADAFDGQSLLVEPSLVEVQNGSVQINGIFDFETLGQVSMWAEAGNLDAGQIIVDADNFIHDPTLPAPVTLGSFTANNIFLTTGQDLIVDGHMVSLNGVGFTAPGLIDFDNVTSTNGPLTLDADGTIDAGNLSAGTLVAVNGGGDVTLGSIDAATQQAIVQSTGGGISTGDIDAGTFVGLQAQNDISAGDIASGDSIDITSSSGGISVGNLLALTTIRLDAPTGILFGDAQADDIDFDSGGAVTGGNIVAGTVASGSAGGAINLGNIDVGILLTGGLADDGFAAGFSSATSINVGDVAADEAIGFATFGNLTTGDLNAGTDVMTLIGGDTTIASITTPSTGRTYHGDVQMFLDAGGPDNFDPSLVFGATPVRSGGSYTVTGPIVTGQIQVAAASITTGNVTAPIGIYLDSADSLSTGDLASDGLIQAISDGDMSLADVSAGTDVLLDSGGAMSLGDVTAQTGSVQASAVGALTYGSITAGTFVTIDPTSIVGGDITALAGDVNLTGDSIDIGNVSASDNVILTALAGDLSTVDITAGIDVTLDATGDVNAGDITAGGLIQATGASLTLGNLNANSIDLTTTVADLTVGNVTIPGNLSLTTAGDLIFGNLSAFDVDLFATANMTGGNIDSATDITAVAGADMDVGDLSAGGATIEGFLDGLVQLSAGGSVNTGLIDAFNSVEIDAGTDILTDDILAGDFIDIFSSGGDISTGDLTGTSIDLNTDVGDISFANVDADDFDFNAGGTVTGGNIVATTTVSGETEGAVSLGNITVGPNIPLNDDFSVGIASATSITVGNVTGPSHIGFATFGDLTTGNLTGGDLVMTLVGGDISTGSITTASNGRVYMADASMFATGGGGDGGDFDQNIVLALDPVATGGSIAIGGPVSTGRFQAAAGANLTTGAITANQIEASAGGLATINGMWLTPFAELWSNDIAIGANGGIDGGTSGLIRLVSTNTTQALIGDGLTGTGYQLSNAEFGRLSAGEVQIAARGDASAAIDMLIGDLTVTGPTAGSTIEDPLGSLIFATGDPQTQVAGGVIRIVGDLVATGFADTTSIEFLTGRFELDAATGLLQITSTGTNLSGEIFIDADRVHVASGTILDQLAVDPHYSGYQDDLNAPAEIQRPDGVIRAGSIEVFSSGPLAVLVQNTGTADLPAGFLTFGDEPLLTGVEGQIGPIEMIINGQLITEGGQLTGIDVRDFLIDANNVGFFTDNSTINGCPLVGDCVVGPVEPPIPPDFQPSPGIQDEVTLIDDNLLPPPDFGNEDFIDDNDDETDDGATSPIEPPDPLFDTSELGEEAQGTGPEVGTSMRSSTGLTDTGDVDDPVSGSGNPALMETPPGPPSNEEKQQ